jgi:hypothetical protein
MFRAFVALVILLGAGVLEASAQHGVPGPHQPAHRCRANFQQCVDRCNARGGVGGTDHTCADRCGAERNCSNEAELNQPSANDGASEKADRRGQASSCAKALASCQAHCTAGGGSATCATNGCLKVHAQCLATGCWRTPHANSCGLAKN